MCKYGLITDDSKLRLANSPKQSKSKNLIIKIYIILAKENQSGKHFVQEVRGSDNEYVKNKFFKMYSENHFEIVSINDKLEEIAVNDAIKVNDVVEIVCTKLHYTNRIHADLLGAKGIVESIDPHWGAPYSIRFMNEYEHLNDEEFLFQAKHLCKID